MKKAAAEMRQETDANKSPSSLPFSSFTHHFAKAHSLRKAENAPPNSVGKGRNCQCFYAVLKPLIFKSEKKYFPWTVLTSKFTQYLKFHEMDMPMVETRQQSEADLFLVIK